MWWFWKRNEKKRWLKRKRSREDETERRGRNASAAGGSRGAARSLDGDRPWGVTGRKPVTDLGQRPARAGTNARRALREQWAEGVDWRTQRGSMGAEETPRRRRAERRCAGAGAAYNYGPNCGLKPTVSQRSIEAMMVTIMVIIICCVYM